MKRKTTADRILELAYSATDAKSSQEQIELLKAIHAKRFAGHERIAAKVRKPKEPAKLEAV